MSVLLLPRLGVGNAVAFNNNFSVTKDGNPWSDGGSDTFDGTGGVQITTSDGWLMVGGSAYTGADKVWQSARAFASGVVDVGVYAGWATAGIFACEIELGYQPAVPVGLRFTCNTGYDNGSPTGVATRSFTLGEAVYELKTVWTSYGQRDSWRSTGETQLTVTVVPYLAAQNLAGANHFTWFGSGDDRDYRLAEVRRGATMYIQWGKVDVAAVQDWIVGDLVASEEWADAPHERQPLAITPPSARAAGLSRQHSSCSDLWARPGGYDAAVRGLPHHRRSTYFSGPGVIVGTVKRKGTQVDVPMARRVQLLDERAHVVVQETWSDAQTGAYQFDHLNPNVRYLVMAYDHTQQYRAVVADNLRAEVPEKALR